MHAERDYLVKSVFPALSEWCEQRKLRLIDIDLRWGVTAADSEAKNTVRACLRNIDECRPFFLCFLGQRRGWVPSAEDIGADTYELFPQLNDKGYIGDVSVTEMEILHALVDPLHSGILRGTRDDSRSGQAVEHAFFYLRDPGYLTGVTNPNLRAIYTNEAENDTVTADRELARWREIEIPNTGSPVYHYATDWQHNECTPEIAMPLCVPTTAPNGSDVWSAAFAVWEKNWAKVGIAVDNSGEITGTQLEKAKAYNEQLTSGRLGGFVVDGSPLADIVIKQLKDAIGYRYPEHMNTEESTPMQKELDQQAQFLRIASEGFIKRTGDTQPLSEYLQNDDKRPLAVTAYAGMGKTSLLAHFIDTYTTRSNESLHYRFIGGSDDSVSATRLIHSLLSELEEAGKIRSDIPANTTDMINKLPDLLAEAGRTGKTILIIDALNQLESGMSDLSWIPAALPDGIKMIVSFKRGEDSADEYYRNQEKVNTMIFYSVKPFDSELDRKALVSAYLEQYFKELDEPRIQTLINSDGADNPLFLKAALSELRVFGVHNDLSEVIRTRFGNTPVTAFSAILSRMESDPTYTSLTPNITLPHLFGWIAHSRYGMSVEELADLFISEDLAETRTDALDAIYLILRQLRPFLAKRAGRIDFFYESFRIAAAQRYTTDNQFARNTESWHKSLAGYFMTLPIENQHKLMEQAWQYAMAQMKKELEDLLFDYLYNDKRLMMFGPGSLIEDCGYLPFGPANILKEFYNLAYPILYSHPDQLATQLWARMADIADPYCKNLLQQSIEVKQARGEKWLRPLFKCMDAPGDSVSFTIKSINDDLGFCMALSPDEKTMITELRPNILAVWDIAERKIIRKILLGEKGRVWHIKYNPDGTRFAIISNFSGNDEIRIWDAISYIESCKISDLTIYTKQSNGVATKVFGSFIFTSDSRCIMVQTHKGLELFDSLSGSSLSCIKDHLSVFSYGMGTSLIAIGGWKSNNMEISEKSEKRARSFFSKKKEQPKNKDSGTIRLLDYDPLDCSLTVHNEPLARYPDGVRHVAVSSNDRYVASVSFAAKIQLWGASSHMLMGQIDLDRQVSTIRFIKNDRRLLVSCYDGFIYTFNLPDLSYDSKIPCGFGGITDAAVYRDEKKCLAMSEDKQTIKIVSLENAPDRLSCGSPINSIGLDKDRNRIVASSYRNYIEYGRIPANKPEEQSKLHFFATTDNSYLFSLPLEARVADFVFVSPNGKSVVSKNAVFGNDFSSAGITHWSLVDVSMSADIRIPKNHTISVPDFYTGSCKAMNDIRFSSNHKHAIVLQREKETIFVYRIHTKELLCKFDAKCLVDKEDDRYDVFSYEYEVSPNGEVLFVLDYCTCNLTILDIPTGKIKEHFVIEGFTPNEWGPGYYENNGMVYLPSQDKLIYYDARFVELVDIPSRKAIFILDRGRNKHCLNDDHSDNNCFVATDVDGCMLYLSRELSGEPREECFDVWDMRTGEFVARMFANGHFSNAVVDGGIIRLGLTNGHVCTVNIENSRI